MDAVQASYADRVALRATIVDLILATDMKQHFMLLSRLQARTRCDCTCCLLPLSSNELQHVMVLELFMCLCSSHVHQPGSRVGVNVLGLACIEASDIA